VELRLPSDLRPGKRRLVFTGVDVDLPGGELFELFEFDFELGGSGGSLGPPSLRRLLRRLAGVGRYDGISARRAGTGADDLEPSYRDPNLRISGSARATIRIKKRP
jgi:hypothetical protein